MDQTCLLFFIDETGHETFADKNYPVFGLAGCAIKLFGGSSQGHCARRRPRISRGVDVPLHAKELRNATTEQFDAGATTEGDFAAPARDFCDTDVTPSK